jgi:hypothetical protein
MMGDCGGFKRVNLEVKVEEANENESIVGMNGVRL